MTSAPSSRPLALILAAGLGTRMRSPLAKVLHPLCGRPMVAWVVAAARETGCDVAAVVHHQEEAVRAALPGVACARQDQPRGTGDAVRAAQALLPPRGTVLVLPGDAPLVRPGLLRALLGSHGGAFCTVLSARISEPGEFGRIVREGGRALGIVEASEATPEQLAIHEVNSGIYAFDAAWLREVVLPSLQPHPPKGELYLTDAVALAARAGRLQATCLDDWASLQGINDRAALARAEDLLQDRLIEAHGRAGVSIQRPGTVRIEAEVVLGADVLLEPGVVLCGRTRIGAGVRVGAHSVLRDAEVGEGAVIHPSSVLEGAVVGPEAQIGPFARLRPGTHIGARARVGNFVETKNAVLGEGAKASHLTYLGDATVGPAANIGAGTITCNYDGFAKHRTVIGAGAFIGSNTALVAPVSVGDGALVGAGSTITASVPAEALAVSRPRQATYPDGAPAIRDQFRQRAEELRHARKKGET
jgi:bifunctional UDP-N-acetylglucosamine pyrophosphorylase/glucosamine-1-phosphate N-acetyltransferase